MWVAHMAHARRRDRGCKGQGRKGRRGITRAAQAALRAEARGHRLSGGSLALDRREGAAPPSHSVLFGWCLCLVFAARCEAATFGRLSHRCENETSVCRSAVSHPEIVPNRVLTGPSASAMGCGTREWPRELKFRDKRDGGDRIVKKCSRAVSGDDLHSTRATTARAHPRRSGPSISGRPSPAYRLKRGVQLSLSSSSSSESSSSAMARSIVSIVIR